MKTLKSYFEDKEIIEFLAKRRALVAKSRHDLHFHRNISSSARNPQSHQAEVNKYFPPRNQWIRPQLNERRNKHSLKLNQISLIRTVQRSRNVKIGPPPLWLVELEKFINEIRSLALSSSPNSIKEPQIVPFRKEEGKIECRPIAIYEISDRLIISQVAKYFINCFDEDFLDCSYAFRSSGGYRPSKTHHLAVRAILEHLKKNNENEIWASECDIKKFYDCVNHDIAIESLDLAIERCKKRGVEVDKRARELFIQYLDSYSFNHTILPKNTQPDHFNRYGINGGKYNWIDELELQAVYSTKCPSERIGVPQGGAISCLIANLVLHRVDVEMMKDVSADEMCYARFCDDMVILHKSERNCEEKYRCYENNLKKLKLITHSPVNITQYGKEFWDPKTKSKHPYRWENPIKHKGSVPWLAFVGYQIRYDEKIRIRPKSLKKELEKQVEECDKILKNLRVHTFKKGTIKSTDKSTGQILFRLSQRYISMSVGRVKLGITAKGVGQFCWSVGFQLLKNRNFVKSQIKKLDKNRNRQLFRLKRKLKYNRNVVSQLNKSETLFDYYGNPFSYFNQFK